MGLNRNYDRVMDGPIVFVTDRCINEGNAVNDLNSSALMDMPPDMVLRLNLKDLTQ